MGGRGGSGALGGWGLSVGSCVVLGSGAALMSGGTRTMEDVTAVVSARYKDSRSALVGFDDAIWGMFGAVRKVRFRLALFDAIRNIGFTTDALAGLFFSDEMGNFGTENFEAAQGCLKDCSGGGRMDEHLVYEPPDGGEV
jgi:hypothetical protein